MPRIFAEQGWRGLAAVRPSHCMTAYLHRWNFFPCLACCHFALVTHEHALELLTRLKRVTLYIGIPVFGIPAWCMTQHEYK
jgi:hypothetical protein